MRRSPASHERFRDILSGNCSQNSSKKIDMVKLYRGATKLYSLIDQKLDIEDDASSSTFDLSLPTSSTNGNTMASPIEPLALNGEMKTTASPWMQDCEKRDSATNEQAVLATPRDEVARPAKKPFSFYLAFLALNISTFIVSLDATALSVAIPVRAFYLYSAPLLKRSQKITADLHGTTLQAFWSSLSFLLAVVITQPIYTSISNVLGRTAPFYLAFLFFLLGSLVFALAPNMPVLIVGRILQGIGGGGLDVLSEVILVDITSLKERPLYLGLFALPMAGGAVCGPLIGAAFSEYVDWRWIGWVNLPFAAVGAALTFFFLRLRKMEGGVRQKLKRVDWLGICVFAVGSTAFTLPLSWAGGMYSWGSWRTLLPLIVGLVVLAGFAVYERRPVEPVFPYRIFENRTAVVSILGGTIHGMILYSSTFYAPLFFQAVMLDAPVESAIAILPAGASVIGFSVVSAIVVEVIRKYRWMIIIAWICGTSGVGLWAIWGPSSAVALTAGLQVIFGVGIGTLFTVLTIPMQASVRDVDDSGIAAGTLVSFRLFGGLVGLAICAGVFNDVFGRSIAAIEELPPSLVGLKDIREAIALIPALNAADIKPAELAQIIEAYRKGFMAVFLTLSGTGVIGFFTSLLTKEISLEKEDLGRQRFEDTP